MSRWRGKTVCATREGTQPSSAQERKENEAQIKDRGKSLKNKPSFHEKRQEGVAKKSVDARWKRRKKTTQNRNEGKRQLEEYC